MNSLSVSRLLVSPKPNPQATVRLFCPPYGGHFFLHTAQGEILRTIADKLDATRFEPGASLSIM